MESLILLADGAALIKVVFTVVTIIIVIFGKVLSAVNKQPPAGRAGGGLKRPPQRKAPLDDEIDAFLRDVKQGRADRQDNGGSRTGGGANRPPTRRREPSLAQTLAAEGTEASLASRGAAGRTPLPQGEKIRGNSARMGGADSDRFAPEAPQLGPDVGQQSGERIAEHLHDVFDHELGQLDRGEAVAGAAGSAAGAEAGTSAGNVSGGEAMPDIATEIRKVFADPSDVRKAIVMHEILIPPSDRW